jgi:hypothetical protein
MLKYILAAYRIAIILYVVPRALLGLWWFVRDLVSLIKGHIKK